MIGTCINNLRIAGIAIDGVVNDCSVAADFVTDSCGNVVIDQVVIIYVVSAVGVGIQPLAFVVMNYIVANRDIITVEFGPASLPFSAYVVGIVVRDCVRIVQAAVAWTTKSHLTIVVNVAV